MSKKIIILAILFFLAIIFIPGLPVRADAAPPEPPNGEIIQPGVETTMVQMVAEEVIIDVGSTFDTISMDDEFPYRTTSGYRLAYNCTFWMVNQGTETESMNVRFPIRSAYEVGKLEIVSIKVDGDPVEWWEDDIVWNQDYNWAHFPVTFPPGEEVEMKVTYSTLTYANGYLHGIPHDSLNYILATGAGWYGPIGKGTIIIRFPYKATSENVFLGYQEKPFQFTESDLYWEFTDLEPTSNDNLFLEFVSPNRWLQIISEREKLEGSPNNVASLHRLAAAIFDVTVYEGAFGLIAPEPLFIQGLEAIGKAAHLAPNDLDIQILYLGYLITNASEENLDLLEDELAHIQSLDIELGQEDGFTIMAAEQKIAYLKTPKENTPEPTMSPESAATNTQEASPSSTPTPTRQPEMTPEKTYLPSATPLPEVVERSAVLPTWLILVLSAAGLGMLVVIGLVIWLIQRR